jgi:hypothetical protein
MTDSRTRPWLGNMQHHFDVAAALAPKIALDTYNPMGSF